MVLMVTSVAAVARVQQRVTRVGTILLFFCIVRVYYLLTYTSMISVIIKNHGIIKKWIKWIKMTKMVIYTFTHNDIFYLTYIIHGNI